MRWNALPAACALMLAVGLDPRIALAQGAKENPAEAAFREGRALMQSGDLERACAKLAAAQEPAKQGAAG
jgi:hypothetical protein